MENTEIRTEAATENPAHGFDDLLRERDFQSEFDRRVSRALETARGKWAQETKKQIETAREEAERSARAAGAAEIAAREEALRLRESDIALRELRADAARMLQERGLPNELMHAMDLSSAERVEVSMDAAEKAFRRAVQSGVEARMRGAAPVSARRFEEASASDEDYYRRHYAPINR